MKRVIRQGVFETNSSSVHSLTICTEDQYNKWLHGEVFKGWRDNWYSVEEVKKAILENDHDFDFTNQKLFIKTAKSYEFYTYENYNNDYECFDKEFVTPSGDKMVAFGYYGEDR